MELKYEIQPKMLWLRKYASNSVQVNVQLLGYKCVSRHAKKGQGKDMLFLLQYCSTIPKQSHNSLFSCASTVWLFLTSFRV